MHVCNYFELGAAWGVFAKYMCAGGLVVTFMVRVSPESGKHLFGRRAVVLPILSIAWNDDSFLVFIALSALYVKAAFRPSWVT